MKKVLIIILSLLPLVMSLLLYSHIPQIIPVHYGFNGIVDRYAGKGELFIIPVILLALGIIGLFMTKKLETSQRNQEITYTIITLILGFLNLLTALFLYCALNNIQNLSAIGGEKLILGGCAILEIFMGNIMPRVRPTKYIGLHVSWILNNEIVWKKTQRFLGYMMFFSGILSLLGAFFLPSVWAFVIFLGLLLLTWLGSLYYSYRIAKAA